MPTDLPFFRSSGDPWRSPFCSGSQSTSASRGQRRLGLRDIQRLLERDRDILLP